MYYVKNVLFLGLCFLVGMGLMYGVRCFREGRVEEVSRIGVGNAPPWRGVAMRLDDSTAEVIAGLPKLRATAISLAYPAAGTGQEVLARRLCFMVSTPFSATKNFTN